MHIATHARITRQWALEAGFTQDEADELAKWNVAVDHAFPGRRFRYKRFHLVLWGARRLAEEYLQAAVDERSLPYLGVALHCVQDAIGHGIVGSVVHWPWLDAWEKRSERVRTRIEVESKRLMRAYREAEHLGDGFGASRVSEELPLPRAT